VNNITIDRAVVEQAVQSLEKAFNFDGGDVFGIMHNDTLDVMDDLNAALANAEQSRVPLTPEQRVDIC